MEKIPKAPCPSYNSLPRDLWWRDLNVLTFECQTKAQRMCNPFLFGYSGECVVKNGTKDCSSLRPHCLDISKSTTDWCYQKFSKSANKVFKDLPEKPVAGATLFEIAPYKKAEEIDKACKEIKTNFT